MSASEFDHHPGMKPRRATPPPEGSVGPGVTGSALVYKSGGSVNNAVIASEIAAERLCMALLKAETEAPGSLAVLRLALDVAVNVSPESTGTVASVWHRMRDLTEAVENDLREASDHG